MSAAKLHTRTKLRETLIYWKGGVRLYIAFAIVLLTGQLWWWAQSMYSDTPELMTSRLHEAFGWTALAWLTIALCIGPLYKLAPRLAGASLMRDARRLIGIGAAWFASLHAAVAYFVSFQAVNPLQLTATYRKGFLLGAVALLILLAMAFTSFDKAFRTMGIWWFRLHRLIYAGSIIAIWHALTIGVHAASMPALAIAITFGVLLFIIHLQVVLQQSRAITMWQIVGLCVVGLLIIVLSNYGVQLYINQNSFQGHSH